ncbi:unnamed protein product [Discosporangium mesarthrocarpum]
MFEKHIWICAFMLSGSKNKCNIGSVEKDHGPEVRSLIKELSAAITAEKGVTFEDGVEDRLCAYARSVAHYPAALKEFPWRNGYFWSISKAAAAEGRPDPCPIHSQILKGVAEEQGLSL